MLKTIAVGTLIALAGLATAINAQSATLPTPTPAVADTKVNSRPPQPQPEPFDSADVKTMASKCVVLATDAGAIEIELYPESARESVRNFLNLAAIGALDTTAFTRVVPGFVIQGGNLYSREGKMTSALGYRARKTIPDEPNAIRHERGVLSMARTDEPNSATTNFFILVGPGSHLDGTFAAFGRVRKGIEVVDVINKAPVTDEKPDSPVRIRTAKINSCQLDPVSAPGEQKQ